MIEQMRKTWAIVPAAGIGRRMKADRPKQYLLLNGKPMLEQTLKCLASVADIQAIVVCLADSDADWQHIKQPDCTEIIIANGGKERSDSVLNGLWALQDRVQENDWVMVHDAARPCVQADDIQALQHYLRQNPNTDGGILGVPVKDTLKAVNTVSRIEKTVSRDQLWHALTPQIFPYKKLLQALQNVLENQLPITDDAQAMELMGYSVAIIEASPTNIKITHPADITMAELFLQAQDHMVNKT